MALPSIEELDAAYEAGLAAPPYADNPHFFCTGLWTQWNFGHRVGMTLRHHEHHQQRINFLGRVLIYAVVAAVAYSLGHYAVL